jgi:hypothetical protein
MKKCKCFGSESDIVQWEAPENHGGDKDKPLHICIRCGHAHAHAARPDFGRSDAEDQAYSSGDGKTAL